MYIKRRKSFTGKFQAIKMLKFLLVLTVYVPFVISFFPGLMLGPGRWLVLNVMTCDNPEQYDLLFDISRKKINRTHDCFDIHINLDRVIDNTYAVDRNRRLSEGGWRLQVLPNYS
ncbi:hypothetical protein HF086_001550 [Spodoptera exigua]|uniref:Uncharacterized protein n=1 Tax=Spodoptera exigua TaxID=7107 RepID=A0A922MS59_SPOEX|nr:hypothetical protein HF086_001550 [Spodoptera exigua]